MSRLPIWQCLCGTLRVWTTIRSRVRLSSTERRREVESNATTGSGPGASFLGSDTRAAYYGGTLTGSGQSLGLLEHYGTDQVDLNTYYQNAGQTNNVPITLDSTDGTSTSCDDTEQTLDMTQALGMAPGLSSRVMYVGSRRRDFQCHGDCKPAERAVKLFLDVESS